MVRDARPSLGDAVLTAVGEALSAAVRETHDVGRLPPDVDGHAGALVDAFNKRDPGAWTSVFHPGVEFRPSTLIGSRSRYKGHPGVLCYLDELTKAGASQRTRMRRVRSSAATGSFFTPRCCSARRWSRLRGDHPVADGQSIEATAYLSDQETLQTPSEWRPVEPDCGSTTLGAVRVQSVVGGSTGADPHGCAEAAVASTLYMKGGLAMSTVSHQASQPASDARGMHLRVLVPEMWASLAIAVIWLVVLFDALFGPDIVANSAAGDFTRVPSVIIVAFFAFLGTWVVARHGFGHSTKPTDPQ